MKNLELQLEKKELPKLKKENAMMAEKIKSLENETDIVKWYLEVMEDGVDTRELVEKYADLKKEHKTLKKYSESNIKKLTSKNKQLTKKLNDAMVRLEQQ